MYNKLFTKILDSSIWLESTPTRIVWVTFLAAMDEDGFVGFATVGNVANRARVTLDEAADAIKVLESPDGPAGEQEYDGRRIERVPRGWMVLNAHKYRELVTRAIIQAQTRARVQKHRDSKRKRKRNAPVTTAQEQVTVGYGNVTPLVSVSEAGSEEGRKQKSLPPSARSHRPVFSGQRVVVHEWMLDELDRLLGPHFMAFDVHEWFFSLDADCVKNGWIPPARDNAAWLKQQAVLEAQKRGLPLTIVEASANGGKPDYATLAKRGPSKRPTA